MQIPELSTIFQNFFSLFPGLFASNFQEFSRSFDKIPGLSRSFKDMYEQQQQNFFFAK